MDEEVEFIGARVVKPEDDHDKTREYNKETYQVLVSGEGIGPDDLNPPPSTIPGGMVCCC